jgi:HTH-type transcriptional regulator, sugar sensing transcriptional regulator
LDELLAMFTQLGFGEYEARAYVALLQYGPVNGYELARHSGVPRGSIYGALARLEEKCAAIRLEAPAGTRYAAVPAEEVLHRLAGGFQRTLGRLGDLLAELSEPQQADDVWNASGYGALLDHARSLVESAGQRLLLATWPEESAALSEETAGALGRNVEVSTLCLANCPQECGHCRGRVYRYPTRAEPDLRWLLVVPDGREMLAAEIHFTEGGEQPANASVVRTRQRLLVNLAESYIRQSTALAAVMGGLGAHLESALPPETCDVLESLDSDWMVTHGIR